MAGGQAAVVLTRAMNVPFTMTFATRFDFEEAE